MQDKELQEQRDFLTSVPTGLPTVTVGGLSVTLLAEQGPWPVGEALRPFVGQGAGELTLRVHLGLLAAHGRPRLRYAPGRRIAGTRPWTVRAERDGGFLLAVKGPTRSTSPERVMRVAVDWSRGDLFVRVDERWSGAARFPLGFPLDVVFFTSALAHRGGLVVHASGVVLDGHGLAFVGPSGAGKTTIARLLEAHGARVLSDERIVLRVQDGRILMYGTPWPGDLGRANPGPAPLAALCFLARAATSRAAPMDSAAAARALLPRCRLPFWDRCAMEGLLGTIGEIASRVPSVTLAFAPDRSALACVAALAGRAAGGEETGEIALSRADFL